MNKILKPSIFVKFGLATTAYGIPNLIRSKKSYQKALWVFFILSSMIASFFLINEAIFSYLDYKTVTVVQTLYESPVEFPTLSICPYNKQYLNNTNFKDVILDCYFGYDYTCKSDPKNYFEPFYSTEYGPCFRFNSGKNYTLHSKTMLYSKIGGVDDSFSFSIEKSRDMAVWIHNKSQLPNLDYKNNHYHSRVFASASSYTEITIQRVIETKLGEPYNNCLNDATEFKLNKTIIDYLQMINQTYSQQKCFELCFDIYYIEANLCNCVNTSLGNVWIDCWNKKENENKNSCTYNFKIDFYEKNFLEKCFKFCPLECTSISYNFHSTTMANYDKTKVRIYFSDLKHISITQEPKMLLIDLISNIGGTLGLLVGLSFVSFFEILEILIAIIFY